MQNKIKAYFLLEKLTFCVGFLRFATVCGDVYSFYIDDRDRLYTFVRSDYQVLRAL